jgi:hypothetical protein
MVCDALFMWELMHSTSFVESLSVRGDQLSTFLLLSRALKTFPVPSALLSHCIVSMRFEHDMSLPIPSQPISANHRPHNCRTSPSL